MDHEATAMDIHNQLDRRALIAGIGGSAERRK